MADKEEVEALAEWGYSNADPRIAEVIPWKRAYGPLKTVWRKKARAFLADHASMHYETSEQ